MKRATGPSLFAALLVLGGMAASAAVVHGDGADARFSKRPVVRRDGDKVTVEFSVSRGTDVAVYVEDGKGKIIRHLAAGLLGKNSPEPLKPDSLEQTLVWDGRDDDGNKVRGESFRVRVGLGLNVSWGGTAFSSPSGPNSLEGVMGLVAGPDGRVYVLDRATGWYTWGGSKIHVFLRNGEYEKTIKPFPSHLPMDRVKATGAFRNSIGRLNPVIYRPSGFAFYPYEEVGELWYRCQQPAITPEGRLVLAASAADGSSRALATIDTDGGTPDSPYAGPSLQGAGWTACPCLASGPDGRVVFFTGVGDFNAYGPAKPWHAVYQVKMPDRGPAHVLFGDPAKTGDDNTHLSDPRGIAHDGKGHLLIADFGNNRVVAVRDSDGSFAGSFAVEKPSALAVHPRTGAVYLCSKDSQIVKYTGWQDGRPRARLDASGLLAKVGEGYRSLARIHSALFTLDAGADPPVLWIGCGPQLVRCEDLGERFSEPTRAAYYHPDSVGRPAADPTKRWVCARVGGGWSNQVGILEEETGLYRIVTAEMGEGANPRLGPDGTVYTCSHHGGVIWSVKDPSGKVLRKRLPHGTGSTGTTCWERDFSIDRRGDIYVRRSGPMYHGLMTVEQFDRDGNFKRTAILSVTDGMYGPRVDPRGNLYLMEAIKPPGEPFPAEFAVATSVPASRRWYDWIYGSIVKFGPGGGAVWFPGCQEREKLRDIEGWRAWWTGEEVSRALRASGGSLEAVVLHPSFRLCLPPIRLDAARYNKFVVRLKNQSEARETRFTWRQDPDSVPAQAKKIAIQPNSDFAEYVFDVSGEQGWKGTVCDFEFAPCFGAPKGAFKLDWARFEGPGGKVQWTFDREDGPEQYARRLPAAMKQEKAAGCLNRKEAVIQGALWWRPGFSAVGDMGAGGTCHCTGSDFDVDDFGRVFAPDTARFRVAVLDTNGNEVLSFGAYGNQDCCGPESHVLDPHGKFFRPRRADDPKDLASPFAEPEIAFAWIVGLAVTDKHAYVADVVNKRTLRVKLGYAVEETCKIP